MPHAYLDTSALVKLYVREPGTDVLLAQVRASPDTVLTILSLSRVELAAAVHRRVRSRDLDSSAASSLLASFERHLSTRFVVQPVTDAVFDLAVALIKRHGLRAYDAVQLGGALHAARGLAEPFTLTFVCSDRDLCDAAAAEGLGVFDPARVR